jgi:hypothetical protein
MSAVQCRYRVQVQDEAGLLPLHRHRLQVRRYKKRPFIYGINHRGDPSFRQVEKRLRQVFLESLESLTNYQHRAPCVCQLIKVGSGNVRVGEKLVMLESEPVKS